MGIKNHTYNNNNCNTYTSITKYNNKLIENQIIDIIYVFARKEIKGRIRPDSDTRSQLLRRSALDR